MPRIVTSRTVQATPEAVWDLMADAKRWPEWVEVIDRMVELPEGELREGSEYREAGGIAPFKGESTWRVSEYERPRRMVHEGDDGQMRITVTHELNASGDGTEFRQTVDLKPRWWMVPLVAMTWPLFMRSRGEAAMEATFDNLQQIVEGDAG